MTDEQIREVVRRYPEAVAKLADTMAESWRIATESMSQAVEAVTQAIKDHPELFPMIRVAEADEPKIRGQA